MKDLVAEFLGTFGLVFVITSTIAGTAALSTEFGIVNLLAIALAAGLALSAMVFAFGHASGGHFNPAITIGLASRGDFAWKRVPGYIVAQSLGGLLASFTLLAMAKNTELGATTVGGFGLGGAVLFEFVATALFALVIVSVTHPKTGAGPPAPIAIGFYLLAAHVAGIPFSGASLNPARSLGPALLTGGDALGQLALYLVVPTAGAIAGMLLHKWLIDTPAHAPAKTQNGTKKN